MRNLIIVFVVCFIFHKALADDRCRCSYGACGKSEVRLAKCKIGSLCCSYRNIYGYDYDYAYDGRYAGGNQGSYGRYGAGSGPIFGIDHGYDYWHGNYGYGGQRKDRRLKS